MTLAAGHREGLPATRDVFAAVPDKAAERVDDRERHVVPPCGIDLAACPQASACRSETGVCCDTTVLRASVRGLRLLREFSRAVADAVDAATQKGPAGGSRVAVPIESISHAADQLISLGADVETLAPAALCARLRRTAKRLTPLCGARFLRLRCGGMSGEQRDQDDDRNRNAEEQKKQ